MECCHQPQSSLRPIAANCPPTSQGPVTIDLFSVPIVLPFSRMPYNWIREYVIICESFLSFIMILLWFICSACTVFHSFLLLGLFQYLGIPPVTYSSGLFPVLCYFEWNVCECSCISLSVDLCFCFSGVNT